MEQVPHYLIIGNGRLSRHFQYYFSLLGLDYSVWSRSDNLKILSQQLSTCTHVLVLISDRAIEQFILRHLAASNAIRIHCSGALISEHAYGAHPLMTFNQHLYSFEQYRAIPFIIDHDAPDFSILLPGLPNAHVRLHTSLKIKYHALCVLSANFSCLLWQKLFESFENELGIDSGLAHAYLAQQTQNLIINSDDALTGPLVRHDMETIQKHLQALENDPFQIVYQSFVTSYLQARRRS